MCVHMHERAHTCTHTSFYVQQFRCLVRLKQMLSLYKLDIDSKAKSFLIHESKSLFAILFLSPLVFCFVFCFEGTGFEPRMNQQILPAVVCAGMSRSMRYIADTFLPSKSWQFYWKLKASLFRGQWALPFLSAGGSHRGWGFFCWKSGAGDSLKKAEDLSGQDQGRPVGGQMEDNLNGGGGKDKFGVMLRGCWKCSTLTRL